MSADINNFRNEDGGIALDVTTDSEFVSDLVNYEQGTYSEVYIEFYSDEQLKVPVTPTAGTVSVKASPLGNVFLDPQGVGQINAADVSVPNATYEPVVIDGLIKRAKITVSGVSGANFMRAILFNHI